VDEDLIRQVLVTHGGLAVDPASLADTANLYAAGLSSHASVNVLLALEEAFDVEFPDHLLRKSTFQSVAAISAAVRELSVEGAH
jgi:acyl carrier protein